MHTVAVYLKLKLMKKQFPNMSFKSLTQLFRFRSLRSGSREELHLFRPASRASFISLLSGEEKGKKVSLIAIRIQ